MPGRKATKRGKTAAQNQNAGDAVNEPSETAVAGKDVNAILNSTYNLKDIPSDNPKAEAESDTENDKEENDAEEKLQNGKNDQASDSQSNSDDVTESPPKKGRKAKAAKKPTKAKADKESDEQELSGMFVL